MKRYIRAMTTNRDKAIQRADFYSRDLIEHVIKIVLFHNSRRSAVMHWIKEIANWLSIVDNLKLKNGKKLKEKDIEDSLFGWMGTELIDYRAALYEFYLNNKKGKFNDDSHESYPEFDYNNITLSEELMKVCNLLVDLTLPVMCEREDHSPNEYVSILAKVFHKYL